MFVYVYSVCVCVHVRVMQLQLLKSIFNNAAYIIIIIIFMKGITSYYSANCTTEDAGFIKDLMTEKVGLCTHTHQLLPLPHIQNVSAYNTRVFKQSGTNGDGYELRLASVATGG